MKDIYELLQEISIDENEFEEMEVSEIERARVKNILKKSIHKRNNWNKKVIKVASCGLICLGVLGVVFPAYAKEIPIIRTISQTIDMIRGYFLTNDSGQSYGTYIITEDGNLKEPDLVAVIGLNNVEGYVRKSDLYGEDIPQNTLEEVEAYMKMKEKQKYKIVPVYKEDGMTVIGEYRID